jgi:hypothetical protein
LQLPIFLLLRESKHLFFLMKTNFSNDIFLAVALRQNAIFIPNNVLVATQKTLQPTTGILCANAAKLGFTFDEPLLHALNSVAMPYKSTILRFLTQIAGVDKNWTPLVKGWDVPTDETFFDHLVTLFYQLKGAKTGTIMACGHYIPDYTFPLDRYNGCPFCGTPFELGSLSLNAQGSRLKVLTLWTEDDATAFLSDLLSSKTALDATQMDSLKQLLSVLPLPEKAEITIKETLMAVITTVLAKGEGEKAAHLFSTPTDILRFLWFQKTGFLQIVEPKTIVKRAANNHNKTRGFYTTKGVDMVAEKAKLDLKYDRKMCLTVAVWLNSVADNAEKTAEMMHPKRGMWVRFIRALRLAEYSKRKGFEPLARLLDVFYNQTYTVWAGRVNYYRLRVDADQTFALLQERPGLFARSLFANMLWFGAAETLDAFEKVCDKIPLRLLFTLNMYAETYFDPHQARTVKPLGGIAKRIAANMLLDMYDTAQLTEMKARITELCLAQAEKHYFTQKVTDGKTGTRTMYIDPLLYSMPIAIGDRSETVQDRPVALQGTRFAVEGDSVRLFLQWGNGLPAQHLDMDLSATVAYETSTTVCSYSNLSPAGCKHSGDIQRIPHKVGTAEYIELHLPTLQKMRAKFVVFTCNAYTNGSLSPNLVVGWMNSKHPMRISEKTGVAYDPSTVQHEVRITQTPAKGLVFGVLDVAKSEIIWLEMPFGGRVAQNLDYKAVQALLAKLNAKMSVGALLELKANAQDICLVSTPDADEVYDTNWAINAAAVTQVLL